MEANNVIYGGSLSYRFMCRYNSGFFFRHPLAAPFKYYWRVEPGVSFPCKLTSDPFLAMQRYGKRYSFVITLGEVPETIPTLWNVTQEFVHRRGGDTSHLSMFAKDGEFNGCHYWSNFEIADLDFFRSDEYIAYFDHLDRAGGFFCATLAQCAARPRAAQAPGSLDASACLSCLQRMRNAASRPGRPA